MNLLTLGRAGVVASLALLAVTAAGADKPDTRPATAASTQPGRTHVVAPGDLDVVIEGDAVFEPHGAAEVRIKPKAYAGELTILACSAKPGDSVRKGDVLLTIDTAAIQRDIESAEIELAGAAANLEKARQDKQLGSEGARLAEQSAREDLDNAKVALKWMTEVENPAMLKQSELTLKQYHDGIEDQQDELDQLKKMYKTEDLTTATADIVIKRSVRQLERSREMLKLFEPQVTKTREVAAPQALAKAKLAVEKAELALQQVRTANAVGQVTRELAVRSAAQAMEKSKRKADELKADLDALKVVAPADGTVFFGSMASGQWQNTNPRALREGEKIAAGTVLLTIVSPEHLRAALAVPEARFADVKLEQKATIKPKLLPRTVYTGRVVAVSQVPGTRPGAAGFDVQIEVANRDSRLAPGMTASVKIEAEKLKGVLVVPNSCLSGDKVLVRAADGKQAEREIVAGKSDGKMTQVIRGLEAGDTVVER